MISFVVASDRPGFTSNNGRLYASIVCYGRFRWSVQCLATTVISKPLFAYPRVFSAHIFVYALCLYHCLRCVQGLAIRGRSRILLLRKT